MENIRIWSVPEGYELDKERSRETMIVLKKTEDKRVKSWQEYCELMKGKDSYVVDMYGNVRTTNFSSTAAVGEFEDKEDVVAFAALHKLISLRKNWVGDWKPDWKSGDPMFTIINSMNSIKSSESCTLNSPLSFPTEKLCEAFVDTFRDLLEQAKPLL